MHQQLVGTQPGQQAQTGQGDVPHHMVSCLAMKLGGIGWGAAITWGLAEHHLVSGEQLYCASIATSFAYSSCFFFKSFSFLIFPY